MSTVENCQSIYMRIICNVFFRLLCWLLSFLFWICDNAYTAYFSLFSKMKCWKIDSVCIAPFDACRTSRTFGAADTKKLFRHKQIAYFEKYAAFVATVAHFTTSLNLFISERLLFFVLECELTLCLFAQTKIRYKKAFNRHFYILITIILLITLK